MKNAVKAVKLDAEEGENRFDRLPDALIVSIFNKLVHAKHLLRCFSVSKRFASLTRQIDTLFIPILMSSPVEEVPFRGLFDLKKFTSIRSLRIEISPSFDNNNNNGVSESLMKYKSVIGARLEILVAVFAMGVHNSGGAPSISGANYGNEVMEEASIMLTRSCLTNALGFHKWSQAPVLNLPELCEMVITCKRVGKVCLGKDQIVGLRDYLVVSGGVKTELSESELIGESGGVGVKIWHAPRVLELPASGRVLEWATVVVVRPEEGEEIEMVRDVDLISSVFGGGEEDEDDDDGKEIDEVLNVVRKKMVSDKNVAFINTRILKLDEEEEEEEDGMNVLLDNEG